VEADRGPGGPSPPHLHGIAAVSQCACQDPPGGASAASCKGLCPGYVGLSGVHGAACLILGVRLKHVLDGGQLAFLTESKCCCWWCPGGGGVGMSGPMCRRRRLLLTCVVLGPCQAFAAAILLSTGDGLLVGCPGAGRGLCVRPPAVRLPLGTPLRSGLPHPHLGVLLLLLLPGSAPLPQVCVSL
jgi:hypothetical protein